jgi:hypothetical protein
MMLNQLFSLENVLSLDYRILCIVGSLLFLSLLLIVLGLRRFIKGKIIIASIQSLSGISLFLAGTLFLSIAVNLYSYDRLTYEQDIADLKFKQVDKQRFQVEISYQNTNDVNHFLINGDEWQIDARVIKWQGWAQILGLNAQYRLERISGRYSDIEEEQQKTRTAYSLGPKDQIDYWKLINDYKKWLPWVDAYYGSATYLPMADNASYSVSLTQTGLIARPLDTKTDDKLKFW